MSLDFKKDIIRINEIIAEDYSETVFEGDIIVPDVKPDILRILQVDGKAIVNKKEIHQDKVIVSGVIKFDILYTPDSESLVKGITSSGTFTHIANMPGVKQEMFVNLECDVEHVEFRLLNGRKLNIKAVIGVGAKVSNVSSIEMVQDIEFDEPLEIRRKKINAFNIISQSENNFTVAEDLEIPSGKPSIVDILKVDYNLTGKDCKIVSNKVVIKGELNISTIFIGDTGDNEIQFMEHEIPFTEVLEIEGIRDTSLCQIDYLITDFKFETKEDSDGESRLLYIETGVLATLCAGEKIQVDIVTDTYGINSNISLQRKMFTLNTIADDIRTQTTIKEVISMPSTLPDIRQVYNIKTRPYISETRLEKNKIKIEGIINTDILYLSDSSENPINNFSKEVPFNYVIDSAYVSEDMDCEIDLSIDHINYNLNLGAEIEMRYIMSIEAKLYESSQSDLITSADIERYSIAQKDMPSLVIYFVQKNDSLWSIAKRYRTSMQDLLDANDMDESDSLSFGQQLIIPKKKNFKV